MLLSSHHSKLPSYQFLAHQLVQKAPGIPGVCGLLIAEKLGVSQPKASEHLKIDLWACSSLPWQVGTIDFDAFR
jgi:hypothetical protein